MGIKAEFGIRYTFTDYIDDVSGLYYDKNLLIQYNGNLAATMSGTESGSLFNYVGYADNTPSDPWPNGAQPYPDQGPRAYRIDRTFTEAGFKRGNANNNDYYAFLNISFYKKFSSHGKVYKSISKERRRRIKASF